MIDHLDTRVLRKSTSATRNLSRQTFASLHGGVRSTPLRTKAQARPINPWLALAALGIGAFLAMLDIAIVNVTLPTLQAQFHADLTMTSWVLHLYNLLFATCLVASGWLADRFGHKRFALLGLLFFASGSALCGVSPSLFWLWSARVLQAIGASLLSAVSMALTYALFPKKQRNLAMSIWGSLSVLGIALGPVIGGLLLSLFGWRSIFLVNIPFCLLGLLLVSAFVPEMRACSRKKPLDVLGLVMITLVLFSLVLALLKGSDWGWASPQILALFGWTIISGIFFVWFERKHPAPILDIPLFFSPGFSLATMATFLSSVALQGGHLFLSLYFLNGRGETAFATAQALLPVSLAALVIPTGVSALARPLTLWFRCLLGMGLMALGLLLFCTLTMQSTALDTMWREIIFGAGSGFCLASFPIVALAEVPQEKLGAASGTLSTFRQLGFVFGMALLISIFSGQMSENMQIARSTTMTMVQTDHRLPVSLRNAMILQFFTPDMQAPPRVSDLVQMTAHHASWQSVGRELMVLSEAMGQVFDTQILRSYTLIWALAASFPITGIGLVVALLISRSSAPRAKMPMAAWNNFYFFSLSGGITPRSIQHYLAAQSHFVPSSRAPAKQRGGHTYASRRETWFALPFA